MSNIETGLEAHIYVVEFSDGRLKVGFTRNPESRLKQLKGDAASAGVEVAQTWTSPSHVEAAENEKALIEWCSKTSQARYKREYFKGVGFQEARQFARGLPMSKATERQLAEREARSAAVTEGLKSIVRGTHPALRRTEDDGPWLVYGGVRARVSFAELAEVAGEVNRVLRHESLPEEGFSAAGSLILLALDTALDAYPERSDEIYEGVKALIKAHLQASGAESKEEEVFLSEYLV